MGYRPTDEERALEGQWWVIEVKGSRTVAKFGYGSFMVHGQPYPLEEVLRIKRVFLHD